MKKHLMLAVLLIPLWAGAAVRLPRIFSDGMILQRDQAMPVWGWAEPGETVRVEFGGQSKSVKSDMDGRWTVLLDPMPASAELCTLRLGEQSITNVLVGDVFQVSGQSNVAMTLDRCRRYPGVPEDIESTLLPEVRIFEVPWGLFKDTPQDDVPASCAWASLEPKRNAGFSALAFYFSRAFYQHLNVPIGIVRASRAGGMAKIKMPKEALLSYDGGKKFYEGAMKFSRRIRTIPCLRMPRNPARTDFIWSRNRRGR